MNREQQSTRLPALSTDSIGQQVSTIKARGLFGEEHDGVDALRTAFKLHAVLSCTIWHSMDEAVSATWLHPDSSSSTVVDNYLCWTFTAVALAFLLARRGKVHHDYDAQKYENERIQKASLTGQKQEKHSSLWALLTWPSLSHLRTRVTLRRTNRESVPSLQLLQPRQLAVADHIKPARAVPSSEEDQLNGPSLSQVPSFAPSSSLSPAPSIAPISPPAEKLEHAEQLQPQLQDLDMDDMTIEYTCFPPNPFSLLFSFCRKVEDEERCERNHHACPQGPAFIF